MQKFLIFLLLVLSACDLQPKITSMPDSIGEFISTRYPALLADPITESDVYNSAATDYGVYASPDLYGAPGAEDYILYASVDDYKLPASVPQSSVSVDTGAPITVASVDDYLIVPMYGTLEKPLVVSQQPSVVNHKVPVSQITVAKGDTLYSLSRKYAIPVNDLAVMNKLVPPFALSVGQKLKVPELAISPRASANSRQPTVVVGKVPVANTRPTPPKISSNPDQKLPKITRRSSSKFSWPVRGKILSSYGAKNNGLFNDGFNIRARRGTKVGAAENGVVAYAGNEVKGMGNLVIIQHSDGWMTVYAHMGKLSVRRGVKVTVGQQIGTVGQTGTVSSPQLHFEIRKGTKAYDPSTYLK
jgi:LysM repeat protein